MKLIKAKLKKEPFLSAEPKAQCCPDYLKNIKNDPDYNEELILDLDNFDIRPIFCAYCYKSLGILHGVYACFKTSLKTRS